ncbi:MobF family relaxase (plasmid) [Nocardia sp. CA-135953]|uniref:MobF family relaxase n=1 Tax=Nocardia sp. CA-135953 TaxID=3239978 RepID=UPI003D99EA8C
MSPHRLSVDAGVDYYTKCVAVHDGHERGRGNLSDYYAEHGEVPGVWLGSGLVAFDDIDAGDLVDGKQMTALYREGLHPNAEAIIAARIEAGDSKKAARKAARLGRPFYKFKIPEGSFRHVVAQELQAWNLAEGNPEDAPVPKDVREEIRTRVGLEMFTAEHGRAPAEGPELTDWISRASRPERRAVAGFDLTFSAVKSVSALWALAPREIREKIEAAHAKAVADGIAYLEKHGCFTRLGKNGVQQVDTEGMIATGFVHRDSRAGDPDLHTHVVVSNKVRTLDGRWRALDGRMVYFHAVAASEVYNARLEQYLGSMLGVEFEDRVARDASKRPVREIAGVPAELLAMWSQRSVRIAAELAKLTTQFQAKHGRAPIATEVWKLAQQATIATRARKHEPRAFAEQLTAWEQQAVELMFGSRAAIDALFADVLGRGSIEPAPMDPAQIAQTAQQVVDTVATHRATWQLNHIRAETERQLRGKVSPEQWETLAEQVVDIALSQPCSIPRGIPDPVPATGVLLRRDGTSVYTTAGSQMYTSAQIVAAEQRLIDASLLDGGRTIPATAVQVALVEYAANNDGWALNPGQRALVAGFATSGARLQVGIAPAGTGKTTSMQVLTRAWTSEGGTVLGLAPTAAAAAVLGAEIATPTATIDMLTTLAERIDAGTLAPDAAPEWVRGIDHRSLVIIDEAAKASTRQLDSAVRFLLDRGASVRLLGDDQQLAAVAAGGVIRDIAHTAGALTLTQVMRFADPGERAASLALREGDPAAIAHYADHGRIHIGTIGAVTDGAFQAWAADTAAGLDSVLLAPTRELVSDLNARARADRLARDPQADTGMEVPLGDGLAASVGDVITTRENAYRLRLSKTDHVRNGYRWIVRALHPDGRITASHIGSGRVVTLPADYVATKTSLGYATTIDSAQGLTSDTSHTVLTGSESRQQAYVALTRGRRENHIHVVTALDGEDTAPQLYQAIHPDTHLDVLTAILGRDGGQVSATTAQRQAADPRARLAHAADAYTDALAVVAQLRTDPTVLEDIDTAAEQLVPGLTDEPAYPTLRHQLSALALGGADPVAILTAAVARRELDTADDRAAVLSWRIDPTGGRRDGAGPLPWLPGLPAVLREDPEYGQHLRAREQQIIELTSEIATLTRSWTTTTAPMWAQPLIGTDPTLLTHIAVWRAAHDVADNDRRLTGAAHPGTAEHRAQVTLDKRAARVLGDQDAHVRRWNAVGNLEPRLTKDPYWPVLAAELTRAAATGVNVPAAILTAYTARPLPIEQPAAALCWRLAAVFENHGPDREFVDMRRQLAADPIRRLTNSELNARARAALDELDDDPALPRWLDRLDLHKAREDHAKVLERNQRITDTADAIRTAQTAAEAAEQARKACKPISDELKAARQKLADTNKMRWRTRAALEADIERLTGELAPLKQALDDAVAHAKTTATATHTPERMWPQALADADPGVLTGAEYEARSRVHRAEAIEARHDKHRQRHLAELETIETEQQRRDALPEPERDLEERARDDLTGRPDPGQGFVAARFARLHNWRPSWTQQEPDTGTEHDPYDNYDDMSGPEPTEPEQPERSPAREPEPQRWRQQPHIYDPGPSSDRGYGI